MQTISIFTCSMGRDKYLRDLINSIDYDDKIEHFIIFQGVKPDEKTKNLIDSIPNIKCEYLKENIGIGMAMNYIYPKLSGDIIIKFDDDAKIISKDFFKHVREINRIHPNLVFSPFPVGLINNLGGPKGSEHYIDYSEGLDTYYTFRKVSHIGGFARISPRHNTGHWRFPNDLIPGISGSEDGIHSQYCINDGIEMAYLESKIVVEHNESSIGQHHRYGEAYFKGRF